MMDLKEQNLKIFSYIRYFDNLKASAIDLDSQGIATVIN